MTRARLRLAAALAMLAGAVVVGPAPPAPADPAASADPPIGTLACDANDWLFPADGEVDAMGTEAHAELQHELFIPEHERRCPQTDGKHQFTETPDALAIRALAQRNVPAHAGPAGLKLGSYVGLDQPLTSQEWTDAVASKPVLAEPNPVWHLPLMIDGFVVVANLPCNPVGAPVLLTPELLADIYSNELHDWGDEALVERSPMLGNCAGLPIEPSVRWGEAWSTAVLKDYMSHGDPAFNALKQRGMLDEWSPFLHIRCWGRSEADMVACASRPGSISYMRYSTAKAHGLTPVLLTNKAGRTPPPAVAPADTWPSGCADAMLDTNDPRTSSPYGFALDWSSYSIVNGTGRLGDAYPLCGIGYIVSLQGTVGMDTAQRQAWIDHFRLMWSNSSQQALKSFGYSPLPSFVVERIRRTVLVAGCIEGVTTNCPS